jgi:radical SAM superfamily enzyme YgiQ (UPF0313 family)
MKVLFLTPPRGSWASFGRHFVPNALHAQLAAFLREERSGGAVNVEVLDCTASSIDWDGITEKVKEISPDMVFLGEPIHANGGVGFIPNLNKAMKMVKDRVPHLKIAVGGVWYPAIHPYLDFVVVGEGEHTLKELARELESERPNLKKIKGLAHRESDDQIVVNERRPLIEDLDELPMPAYDLFPMEKYTGFTHIQPYAEPITSRGCPELCKFCWVWGKFDPRKAGKDMSHWRARSGKKVADELELLEKTYHVKMVYFFDENFNVDRQRIIELCNEMIKRKLTIQWSFLGLARHLVRDIDLFPLMRKAGFCSVLLGIEVSSDEELKWLHKGITINEIKMAIQELRKNDIASVGTWMVGLWEDDEKAIKERFAFVDEADPDLAAVGIFHPNAGSPFWHQYHKLGAIEVTDLRYWDAHHPVCRTQHLSREELGRLTAWAHREYYSKPERISRLLNGYPSSHFGLIAKNYVETVANFSKAASAGELFVESPPSD